jgi:hypothetical protein
VRWLLELVAGALEALGVFRPKKRRAGLKRKCM